MRKGRPWLAIVFEIIYVDLKYLKFWEFSIEPEYDS